MASLAAVAINEGAKFRGSVDYSREIAKINDVVFGSRKKIEFGGDTSGEVDTACVVGQMGALKGFLPVAPTMVKSHLERFIAAQDRGKGTPLTSTVSLEPRSGDGEFTKVVVLKVPEEFSRFTNSARADKVTKMLGENGSMCGGGTTRVFAVAEKEEDLIACGLAVARAAPLYGGTSGKISTTLWSKMCGEIPTGMREKIAVVGENIRSAAALVDLPPNCVNPISFASVCEKIACELKRSGHDVRCEMIEGKQLGEKKFGGIWNVGKGSAESPPVLLRLSWYPEGAKEGDSSTVLVGKGVTFDSGGLSLKSSENMRGMKTDMGGAAGLLGAFISAVECNGNNGKPLHLVECLAENAVGPFSYRVDDVISMYSGLSVEINNTDAEGRLLLADGVAYAARHLNPEVVIDMATLTGASGYATGHLHAAIASNDEELEKRAVVSGRRTGDLVHPLIFCPELHKDQFKSEVADLTNSVKTRTDAPVSAAGWFVYENLRAACEGRSVPSFLHIDMAFPVTWKEGRASGYGVALVADMLGVFDE
ncbi:Leucine aminopeptidase, putative [Perkinsus marinus ATCC 50983]|uniref:Leucine aminopeptidase, putative n=1 Tax=Perkinsus marinus (strain ATCC 50983 / TXsc) TaxID=423536 RepID=C5LXL8_PERM5|nr:Leucine aminopeptidase, putative [Perkinsus marinus ATCC 50983]EEQ98540.1 Leucine aminopeptidase, putative [Perkinsus marinus ATCC 50983]|eukprot:XP_002765823.1 Leucine aminopeptidase, putative [Perkinsus marinus ATCC 50983]